MTLSSAIVGLVVKSTGIWAERPFECSECRRVMVLLASRVVPRSYFDGRPIRTTAAFMRLPVATISERGTVSADLPAMAPEERRTPSFVGIRDRPSAHRASTGSAMLRPIGETVLDPNLLPVNHPIQGVSHVSFPGVAVAASLKPSSSIVRTAG